MNYLTLDFETYYDKDYSLSKKGMTTQAYIMSPKFEVLMASVKWGDGETQVVEAPDLPAFFASVDWAQTAVVNHNSVFDLSILWWRYGYRPALAIDTMSLAQCLGVPLLTGSASLAKCVQLLQEAGYELPSKGGEVVNALGKHRKDFTPAQWEAYKQYCKTDADITWFLFKVLKQYVSDDELAYQDIILRCYTEPRLKVHVPTVEYELARCRAYKAGQLAKVCEQLGCTQDNLAGVLRSNDKFAALLKVMGGITEAEMEQGAQGSFIIPTKVSATTGKTAWAFGKTDVGFKELCESELPFVQAICQARLAAKSSIDETRCEKFLDYASYGFLPMGYKIGGAHTNRMSGGSAGSANMQNLPSGRREGQSDLLRRSIIANDGEVIVNFDASQIEARTLAYVANQQDALGVFASKGDIYSYAASQVYGIPYSEINDGRKSSDPEIAAKYKPIRNYGKVVQLALGFGQGAQGFQRYALLTAGISMDLDEAKRTVNAWRKANSFISGFWKTCDQALQVMVDGGQMYFGGQDGKMFFADGKRFLLGRHVPGIRMPNGLWLNYPNLHVDMSSGKPQFVYDKMGYTGKPLKSKAYGGLITENCIAEDTEVLTDKGWKKIQDITLADKVHDGIEFVTHGGLLFKSEQECVKVDGVYMTPEHEVLTNDGWKQAKVFLSEWSTSQLQRLDRQTLRQLDCLTPPPFRRKKMVVGIPMRLWKNVCEKWQRSSQSYTQRANPLMRMPDPRDAKRSQSHTRSNLTSRILGMAQYEGAMLKPQAQSLPSLWWAGDYGLPRMVSIIPKFLGRYGEYLSRWFRYRPHRQQRGILQSQLPMDDTEIELQQSTQYYSDRNPVRNYELVGVLSTLWYSTINGLLSLARRRSDARARVTAPTKRKVYDILNCDSRHRFVVRGDTDAFIVHNCVQYLAFAIMKQQALWIAKYYPIVMNTHDEWCVVVPRDQAETAAEYMARCMRTAPDYVAGLPLDTEGGWAQSYGAVDDDWSKRPDNPDRVHRFDPNTGDVL
nr:MAG TPA: DNA polymerase I [Caudoviricetes sp.]